MIPKKETQVEWFARLFPEEITREQFEMCRKAELAGLRFLVDFGYLNVREKLLEMDCAGVQ